MDPEEKYEAAWFGWAERRIADDVEAGEDEVEIAIDPLLIEGLAKLEAAGDRSLAALALRFGREAQDLRRELAELRNEHAAEFAAVQKRHATEIASLRTALTRQEEAHACEIEAWRGELGLLSNELAEQRALSRLASSRSGRAHDSEVRLRLMRRELEREAAGELTHG